MNVDSRYKIAVIAPTFFPSYGGMEQVAGLLAQRWSAGHEVTVVTDTPAGNDADTYPYQVLRSPARLQLLNLLKASDVIVAHGLSLKYMPWMLPFRRQSFMVHHTYYQRSIDGRQNWKDRLKLFAARFFHNISVSHAVARHLTAPSQVIHNPYSDRIFSDGGAPKTKDVVFAGRLVSDKGCITLLQSIARLKEKSFPLSCTIVGDGDEEAPLKEFVLKHHLADAVSFTGALSQNRLSEELRKHKVMVVPSIWEEPFGLVVLEGLACGCRVIVSNKGGLPEALGGFGRVFQAGDDVQLTAVLEEELKDRSKPDAGLLKNFLDAHSATRVAETYIRHFESSL